MPFPVSSYISYNIFTPNGVHTQGKYYNRFLFLFCEGVVGLDKYTCRGKFDTAVGLYLNLLFF